MVRFWQYILSITLKKARELAQDYRALLADGY